ncbi:uncharacterized protein OCT59_014461 [Rhizophagus irregularis]|uniref:uncharacterized protein n=1 Tax=Rhizophagus irregularis TaxID=588596 RepID=UPI003320EE2C|nr:hypothetical protein OCT59_014461 [Rhizophagus irregularis]
MRLHPLAESRVVMALLSLESGDERLEISIEELPGDGLCSENASRETKIVKDLVEGLNVWQDKDARDLLPRITKDRVSVFAAKLIRRQER